jgi:ribosomal protein S18 acetylase RimI-like enzyme
LPSLALSKINCVHPDYQRKKLGTLLMNHLLDKVKNNQYVSIGLFTWEGNKTAPEFYSKFGFEKTSAMELKNGKKHGSSAMNIINNYS